MPLCDMLMFRCLPAASLVEITTAAPERPLRALHIPERPRAPEPAPDPPPEPCLCSPSAPRPSTPPEPTARACPAPSAPPVVVGALVTVHKVHARARAVVHHHRILSPPSSGRFLTLTGRAWTFQRRRRRTESSGRHPPSYSRRTRSRHACTPSDSFGTRWA